MKPDLKKDKISFRSWRHRAVPWRDDGTVEKLQMRLFEIEAVMGISNEGLEVANISLGPYPRYTTCSVP